MNLPLPAFWKICLAIVAMGVGGCGAGGDAGPAMLGTAGASGTGNVAPYVTSCLTPSAGCPCPTAGASAACGNVDRISGTYVTCSMGTVTCANGTWGACTGDQVATKAFHGSSAIRTQDLGTPSTCVNNPCDPVCDEVVDTASGFDAGANSGFTTSDAGLSPIPIVQGDGGVRCTGLAVTPPTMNVTVTGLSPLTTSPSAVAMNATYVPVGCYSGLANASWSLDQPSLAAISGGVVTLVSGVAGPIHVQAYSAGFQASALINVTTNVTDSSQVTPVVAGQFSGPAAQADDVQFLYPYPATVFPRAVAAPTVQWDNKGKAASAVKVSIRYPVAGVATYSVATILPESTPPRAALSQDAWAFLDQTAAGQDVLISVQRVVGGVLLQPATETVHIAQKPLRGNIFYTEYDVGAWTATIKSAKPYGTTPAQVALANSGCNPCHSVAANGTTLVSSNWGGSNTSVARVNADGTLTGLANMWNYSGGQDSRGFAYSAISPDGTYALQGLNLWGNTLGTVRSDLVNAGPHGNGSGLTASYYANPNATGPASVTQVDTTVDFAWGATSPVPGISAGSSYSTVWTGFVQPIFSETYTFEVESSDGVVLSVNGQTIINQWNVQADTKWTGTAALSAGSKVPISLKYKNLSNTAQVHLRWTSARQPYGVIAETQLYPASVAPIHGLLGTYFSNIDLTGSTEKRVDPTVDFKWNGGAPVSGWAGSNWSAQWTGQVETPCAGTYQWCVTGDDGVRLWVDGALVANGWVTQGATQYCSARIAETAGILHPIRMDYFQGGGGSEARLSWVSSCAGTSIIPTTDLFPPVVAAPTAGLSATYYSNTDFTGNAVSTIDPSVDFNWNGGSPFAGSSGANLSAEWTGQIQIPCTDAYTFCVSADDGVRLWVNDVLVDDGWGGPGTYCNSVSGSPIPETAGSRLDVKMDYVQLGGASSAQLQWLAGCVGGSPQVIPSAALFPSGDRGLGGYGTAFRKAGDRGSGKPYAILRLPSAVNSPPVDVSSLSPNAWGLGSTAMMVPAFAPNGTKLVFVDGDTAVGASWRQGLSVFDFDPAAKLFQNRRSIVNSVPSGNVIRWPTVENDSQSVIYQTNPTSQDDFGYGGMGPSGYSAIPGKLWSVDMADPVGHPPVSLDTANRGLGGADQDRSYQPTVLPASAGGYRWAVFTSDRQYGNTQNIRPAATTPTTQLWVSALDDTVSAGSDRSHPPFWLPNQVLGSGGGRIRNERAYWVLDACKPSLSDLKPPVAPMSKPFTWSDADIGAVGRAGSASATGGVFSVVGGGDDIWNTNDAFHYVYTPVAGDFQFEARITSVQLADYWSKAGIMLRDSLLANAAHDYMMLNASALTGYQWRSSQSAGSNWTQGPGVSFPYWVRLTRTGSAVVGDVSSDGVAWTMVGTQTSAIGTNAYIGLAVTAHNNSTTTTASFDNVLFGSTVPPDPRPGSVCQDDQDCCGALSSPPTAACKVDVPVAAPVTRHCMLLTASSCVAIGSTCASDSDCCGFPTNTCSAGLCAVPRPPFSYRDLVFTRDYVATCPAPQKPVWRYFDWQTVTPSDSDIKFSAGTALTAAALPATQTDLTVVALGKASGPSITKWTGTDVGASLQAAGQSPSFSYLRVFADFQPSSDLKSGPTLTAWRQQFDCVAAE